MRVPKRFQIGTANHSQVRVLSIIVIVKIYGKSVEKNKKPNFLYRNLRKLQYLRKQSACRFFLVKLKQFSRPTLLHWI
jgi:hypothetical protein